MSLLPVGFGASGDDYTIDNSLRFRSSASAYLSRTPASAGNRKTWTFSFWSKAGTLSAYRRVFSTVAGASQFYFRLDNNDQFTIESAGTVLLNSTPVYRDPSSWYHFLIVLDTTQATASNRLKVYVNGTQVTAFDTTNYPALNSDHQWNNNVAHYISGHGSGEYFDGYVTEANFIDGQALDPTDFGETDATTGVWKPKAYSGTYGTNGFYLPTTATTQAEGFNTVLFTGTSADNQTISDVGFQPDLVWLKSRSNIQNHYLIDSVRGGNSFLYSNATSAENTTRSWLTEFTNDGFTATDQVISNGYTYAAWTWDAGANQASTGISSVAYTGNGVPMKVSGFGFSPDLVWIKTRSSGVGNTNHFLFDTVRGATKHLFSNSTAVEATDATELTSFDTDGFSVGSDISVNGSGESVVAWGWDAGDGDPVTNTEGDVTTTVKANDATGFSIATYTVPSVGSTSFSFGHGLSTAPSVVISKARTATTGWITYHSSVGTGKYLQLNSTNAAATEANSYSAVSSTTVTGGTDTWWGVGQDYVSYCFSEVSGVSKFGSYTGTGSSGNAITGLGFRPGFLMIKRTDATAEWIIVDSTRDPFNSANHILAANDSLPESSYGTTNRNIDFDSDGFTIQSTAAGGTTALNANGGTYIYMAFKGSYSDYVSPLNDTGTIDSRVKANTEKGFSIVSYEGNGSNSTIGHGLSTAPKVIITKVRSSAGDNWAVYHESVGNTGILLLNGTNATVTNSIYWNNTSPTSSVFTVGSANQMNRSGADIIAYCFSEVSGYSKFGSYTGTGVAGLSVTGLGFQPAFLMVKRTDAAEGWQMLDNTRNPVAPHNSLLEANQSNAEITNSSRDTTFDSDGFTINNTSNAMNASGGTYIYMAFADTRDAQFNFDASGNKNNWTPNNINSNASSESSYDIMTDVPTLTDENTANYCTLNPLDKNTSATTSNGNLTQDASASAWRAVRSTYFVSSGKWYWEATVSGSGSDIGMIGISNSSATLSSIPDANAYGYNGTNGQKYTSSSGTAYGASYSNGDVIGIALDMDAGTLTFYKNNASQGTAYSSLSGLFSPTFWQYAGYTWNANFGQRPFKYTPPAGFLPLNTYNLPDSTIEDGGEYFNTVTFSGTGATGNVITGLGFQPDMVWAKSRSVAANHELADIVRGTSKVLFPNLQNIEITDSARFESFDSDGFTLGANSNANGSGYSSVGWAWKANGSGVSNSAGTNGASIASTYSANTTSGFSIITYSGTGSNGTVYHGLGTTPEMIIFKTKTGAIDNWFMYHVGSNTNPASTRMLLNLTNARATNTTYLNATAPATNVLTVGTDSGTNLATNTYVAYCFAGVEGFSAFGSYTGNGSTDGPFIYTGFRPAWVMTKRADSTSNWAITDTTINTYNDTTAALRPNTSDSETTVGTVYVQPVSNGFKINNTNTDTNASGATYIYAAFAENPFKNSLAR